MLSKHMGNTLQNLLNEKQIRKIQVYGFNDLTLRDQDKTWRFSRESIHVGSQSYKLNRIAAVRVVGRALHLYF
jgi:predicted DNA-binding protein YlxM (UPF0122 family)